MKIPSHLQEKNKKTVARFIQKLDIRDFFSMNSITISNYILSHISYYHEYFIPIHSHKYVKINDDETQYILITIENKKQLTFYESYSSLNHKKNINIFFNGFKTLLTTCQIMIQSGVVHFNICPDTISFYDYRPYIHDFSQGFLIQNMNDERKSNLFGKYCPHYIHRPPSYHVLCYIVQNNLPTINVGIIDRVLQDYIDNAIKYGLKLSEDTLVHFRESWAHRLMHKKNEEMLMSEFYYWDIYALFILYLQFLPKEDIIILQNFSEFLKKNICECHRYSLEDIIYCYNLLLGK